MLRHIFNALLQEYNETILLLASMDKHGITLIIYSALYSESVKVSVQEHIHRYDWVHFLSVLCQ